MWERIFGKSRSCSDTRTSAPPCATRTSVMNKLGRQLRRLAELWSESDGRCYQRARSASGCAAVLSEFRRWSLPRRASILSSSLEGVPITIPGTIYGIRNQEPAETNRGHLQTASPRKVPRQVGARGGIYCGVRGSPQRVRYDSWGQFADINDIKEEMLKRLESHFEKWLHP